MTDDIDDIRIIAPPPAFLLDNEEPPVVDYGFGPEDEQPVFETLEDAEAALGPLPVVGPEPDEPDEDGEADEQE